MSPTSPSSPPSEPARILLYSLIACMVLSWSGRYIAIKIALAEMPPLLAATLRVSLAGIVILPLYLGQQAGAKTRDAWQWREAPSMLIFGVLGTAVNQILFMAGLNRTSVALAGMVTVLTPLCVLLIAAAVGIERITRSGARGMLIALAGVAVLQSNRAPCGTAHPTLQGDALIFLATLTPSVFTVFNKRIALIHTGTTINTFGYTCGALLLLPLTVHQAGAHNLANFSAGVWSAIVILALFPSVAGLPHLFLGAQTRRGIASCRVRLSATVVGHCAAAVMLHEAVSPVLLLAGLLILTGVVVTERSREV